MRIYLISDSGGHMTEVLHFTKAFEGHEKIFVSFEDPLAVDLPNAQLIANATWPGPFSLLLLKWRLLIIFFKKKPEVILSTGSHIAIPAFYLGKLLFGAKLIFIECSAQVFSPSKTGKIVYPISDLFFVQWKTCKECYGKKAHYVGGLI